MKKRIFALALAAVMALSLTACDKAEKTSASDKTSVASTDTKTSTDNGSATVDTTAGGTVTIWVADATVDFTKAKAEEFLGQKYPNWTVVVEPVGEGDAAGNMITDVEAGADIFGFAQDQTARLVSAGALMPIMGDYNAWVVDQNSAGAVTGAKVGDQIYAFPMTADNGYFLYYDKSVISDVSTLEGIVAACEAAGKNFYFDLGAWYNVAFFFGTGCECYYDYNNEGSVEACHCNYNSDEGVAALKALINFVASPSFQAGSSVGQAVDWAAIIDGTWDSQDAKNYLGDNYACAKLPTFTVDGKSYQMASFNGMKLLGVKPQTDEAKLEVCLQLAEYLTSADVQLGRFTEFGWGPSNLTAQADPAIAADETLKAFGEQFAFSTPQGNYPGDYWNMGLGGDLQSKEVLNVNTSDADLKAYLATLQDYLMAAK